MVPTNSSGRLLAVLVLASSAPTLGAGCAPVAGPVRIEAVVNPVDDPYSYRLDTAVVEQVTDLHQGEGDWFSVRSGLAASFAGGILTDAKTYKEQVAAFRGTGGQPLQPRVSYDLGQDRWVADDHNSLLYLTLLNNFEQSWEFYRDTMGDRSGATSDHVLISFSDAIVLANEVPIDVPLSPGPAFDNAAYNPGLDAFLVLPDLLTQGIPNAAGLGVIAHEFGHRVHHYNVEVDSGAYAASLAGSDDDAALTGADLFHQATDRGVNEGMADVFASTMMGTPDPFRAVDSPTVAGSGQAAGSGTDRDLEGDLARNLTLQKLLDGTFSNQCGSLPDPAGNADQAVDLQAAYCLGTLTARILWNVADGDVGRMRTEVAPAVLRGLREMGRRGQENGTGFRLWTWIDATALELELSSRDAFCAAAREDLAVAFVLADEAGAPIDACPEPPDMMMMRGGQP